MQENQPNDSETEYSVLPEPTNQKYSLQCQHCQHVFDLSSADISFEVTETDVASMGPKLFYEFTHDGDCPKCGRELSITFDCCEYPSGSIVSPEGSVDGVNYTTEHCLLISHPFVQRPSQNISFDDLLGD